MINKTISYKGHLINFKNLHEKGHNIDKLIINETLFNREDHCFDPLVKLIEKGSVVYDIGAYIGSFAIPMAIEGMKVICFEGFPDNVKRLKENCYPYNIEVHSIAVSDHKETVTTKFNDCSNQEPQEREIEYVVFDDYVNEKGVEQPSLVKLDIEGMETLALKGMTNLLENIRPVWSLGYHKGINITFEGYPGWVSKENGGFDFDRFFELDYYVYNSRGQRIESFGGFGEYICIPK
jgi:FkbM family methyltransferase